MLVAATTSTVSAADLPIPCVAGSCGPGVKGFVSSGQATATSTANTLTVKQQTDRAILNWTSFNIGADGKVVFQQPDVNSIALNRIFQNSPSKIFGSLTANGQVYLVNPNGIVFGATSSVKTAGLLASTLNISDSTFQNGLLSADLLSRGAPALDGSGHPNVLDADGNPVMGPDGKPLKVEISVEKGAQITTAASGQRVMLAAQNVTNAGTISAPDGQVVLAAGEKVYVTASTDPGLRGLLVEVDAGGTAWNQLTGNISANRGNVTVVGLAVNQDGRVSASTTVSANGSIRLLARDSVVQNVNATAAPFSATRAGKLQLGTQSVTSVLPELDSTETAVDDQPQLASRVDLQGRQVVVKSGAQVVVPGGIIAAQAVRSPDIANSSTVAPDTDSRIRVESGAVLDVSGSDAVLPASSNMVTVELRANELKDSPLQRDGALRGKTVVIDRRVGTPLADVSGAIAAIPKTIAERTSAGGSIKLDSEGDVVVATGARMDVSGGKVTYEAGPIQTTKLIGADGKLVDIGQADPNKIYVGIINPTSKKTYDRWGVTEIVNGPGIGQLDPGYVEGQDAGTLQFAAYKMVLNGDFLGSITVGQFQRDPAKTPAGGQFIVGDPTRQSGDSEIRDYRAPSVVFTDERPRIAVSSDAQLPGPRLLELPTDFLSQGFTSTAIYSNGDITVPESLALNLVPGSSLTLQGHGVQVDSNITAPGGKIQLTSTATRPDALIDTLRPYVHVGAAVKLDVSGLWTNDLAALNAGRATTDPLYPNAGSIGITVTRANFASVVPGEFVIGDGVQLVANGGAWVKSQTSTVGGTGGSISIQAGDFDSPLQLGEDIEIAAFGVNGARGGSFTIEAPRIDIAHDSVWAHAQAIDQPEPETPETPEIPETPGNLPPATPEEPTKPKPPAKLVLGDGLFSNFGFSTFSLTASGAGVADDTPDAPLVTFDVLSEAQIDARTKTILLSDASRNVASGSARVDSLGTVTLLPDTLRVASSVSMKVAPRGEVGAAGSGWLRVEAGSNMVADPQSSFSFSSARGVLLAGNITAHAGTVSASVVAPPSAADAGFIADQRVEIAPTASIDLSGIALFAPNDRNLQQGNVLGGGTLNLSALRGYVLINRGAFVDVSGTQAAIDFPDAVSGAGYSRKFVASAAGSVSLRGSEGVQWLGTLSAHAGRGDTGSAAGGTLSVSTTRDDGSFTPPQNETLAATFPTGPRVLTVVQDQSFASAQNGFAVVDANKVVSSGFDSLSLTAGGRIDFAGDVSLALGRQLSLDAPLVSAGTANRVDLSAPFVSWGYSFSPDAKAPATPGGAQLAVRADTIELFGATSLAGFTNSRFEAQHDIRLRNEAAAGTLGTLRASGNLTLAASRIFPLAGQSFEIRAPGIDGDDTTGTIRIEQTGASSGTPLSAGGALSIFARNIVQGGTLLAPFGTLQLNASDTLDLLPGSVTSVSADRTIPFGFVEAGTTWKHNLTLTSIPDRQITLTAPTVRTGEGSTVDLRGGGDLYAYSWVPGTGGTKDRLAAGATPGLYAIIPTEKAPYAVIDPLELANSGLKAGDSVYLAGTADVPAGTYALLPARYALLPGAYLVNATSSGSADIRPGVTSTLPDGGITVAGYRTFGGTGIGDTRYTTWVVHPGSYGRQISGYEDHLASTFFTDQAALHDQPRPVIPADAGRLVLNPGKQLDVRGDVLTTAASGGLGASIDIAAANLAVTAERIVYASPQIDAATLQKWNPHSLVLGGASSDTADGRTIAVSADDVIIGENVNLSLDEIVIAANDSISFQSGARVSSRATSTAVDMPEVNLTLTGSNAAGAAVVAVSDLAVYDVQKSDAAPASLARVDMASNSQLSSRGALLLDAPGGARLEGTLSGAGAAWNLSSDRIVFGESDATDGIVIDSRLSGLLSQGRSIEIAGTGLMDFAESLTVGSAGQDLTLRAGTIHALNDDTQVVFSARTLTLEGAVAGSAAALEAGTSSITARANDIILGPGFLDFDGFSTISLQASRDVRGEGTSRFRTPGALDITAQRVTANTGANTSLEVGDAFRILKANGTSSGAIAGLGGSLKVHAGSIENSGLIELPTGLVSLTADDGLTLSAGSVIDVSGRTVTAAGRSVSSWGGAITLGAGSDLTGVSGSSLLMQGAGAADGGVLALSSGGVLAFDSSLNAHGTKTGGSVTVDADSFSLDANGDSTFGALNSRFETAGFNEARRITVAHGDLNLAAGTTTTARTVELTTNDGSIDVAGSIVALSDSQRAAISLFGAGGVTLESGSSLRAEGMGADGRGGYVTIGTFDGAIDLKSGSAIATRGTQDNGRLWLRAPAIIRDGKDDVNVEGIHSTLTGVDSVVLESVLRYDDLGPVLSDFEFGDYINRADTYAQSAFGNIGARLGGGNVPLRTTVGLDLYSESDVALGSADPFSPGSLDLSSWRSGGEAGALTIRSGGSIAVNGIVSDGFSTDFNGVPSLLDQRSATIRLAAGSAFQSTNPLSVTAGATGDLTFSAFSVLRTGTGDIGLAAAGNVLIGDNDFGGASIYTAGTPAFAAGSTPGVTPLRDTVFPTDGGSISISAGGNIAGARVIGGVGGWQPRAGRGGTTTAVPTQWGTNLSAFNWNVGSFGGGDLAVRAGRDIVELSAAVADSAIEKTPDVLTQFQGGVLSVDAGGDISSVMLHMTRGDNRIRADGALAGGSRLADTGDVLGSFFSLADGTLSIRSRGDTIIEAALQTSALIQPNQSRLSMFLTAGEGSALDVQSAAGDVVFNSESSRLGSFLGGDVANSLYATELGMVPANLRMAALSGDIHVRGQVTMTPSDHGQLDVFAFHDLCSADDGCGIEMADLAAGSVPTALSPLSTDNGVSLALSGPGGARHLNDPLSALITAGHDLNSVGIRVPKAASIAVGHDIIALNLDAQNLRSDDVTLITAGRDITWTGSDGSTLAGQIQVGGPGRLDMLAGRNIDLGLSGGVSTTGNLRNPNLPTTEGADLTMIAGLGKPLDYTDFFDDIVAKSDDGHKAVVDYVSKVTGQTPATYDAAAATFGTLDETTQRPFLLEFFYKELVASGREANENPAAGFKRGYAAIDALLPGARSTDPKAPNPYEGDLMMAFSRIYTLAGGSISLLVPGGLLNVGLANPPPGLADKAPSDLGIVAQRAGDVRIYTAGDVLVNQSRIFTLGGGDIAIWSNFGDIDAGRGSKTSVSAPPPAVRVDSSGKVTLDFAGAVAGSGIRTITATADRNVKPGDVDLIAPAGTVNAGDAGIGAAGNVNIAAQHVVGLDNIQFGGSATGVPSEVSSLGASLSSVSAVASSASNASGSTVGEQAAPPTAAPLAESALGWLDVFVTGFGEDSCSANDAECMKRQQTK